MRIHTCLWHDVRAFHFDERDLLPLAALPNTELSCHESADSFLAVAEDADVLVTWDFPVDWYATCQNLRLIMTPAAGRDWIEPDPEERIPVIHGSFHGGILAESLLSAILYMNHRMLLMQENFRMRQWNRNLQVGCRLLAGQTVIIIGFGNIGQVCGQLIAAMGAEVIGVSRRQASVDFPARCLPVAELDDVLPVADHIVLLLPGDESTDGFMDARRIALCKPGAFLYNFGRGNAIHEEDLVSLWSHLGGAFLDVTAEEPLPADSPLWSLDNIMITPHSSCVYDDYKPRYVTEAVDHLRQFQQRSP